MSRNDDRDNDLDELLKPLKSVSSHDLQMQRWKSAVISAQKISPQHAFTARTKWVLQTVAAGFVGFAIGAAVFGRTDIRFNQPETVAKISAGDATFERSHDNLD